MMMIGVVDALAHREAPELRQVAPVGIDAVAREAPLHLHVIEKQIDRRIERQPHAATIARFDGRRKKLRRS